MIIRENLLIYSILYLERDKYEKRKIMKRGQHNNVGIITPYPGARGENLLQIYLFFFSFNAQFYFFCYFVFFLVNWFYLLYVRLKLGKNCLLVIKLVIRKQKMSVE